MADMYNVLSQEDTEKMKPFFSSRDEFYKKRDDFFQGLQPVLDELNEKRRKSEEAAQTQRYR